MLPALRLLPAVCLLLIFARSAPGESELLSHDRNVEDAIDHYVDARLHQTGVAPAPRADDGALLRRTMLDLAGRIPTLAEVRAYEHNSSPEKHGELIDRLLNSPEFDRAQIDFFDAMLMRSIGSNLRPYLQAAVQDRRPWDRMFREMLVGIDNDPQQTGPLQFVRSRVTDIDKLTNDVSVLFFGVNISCAQCHDHPLVPDWSQEHFYGMKSFFNRSFENGEFVGERNYGAVDFKSVTGDSKTAGMMFLTGEKIVEPDTQELNDEQRKQEKQHLEELKKQKQPPPPPAFSRRTQIVDAGLRPSSMPFFARSIVNRVWHRLMGRGLVNPLDQMHSQNPPSHPELLDWLSRDIAAHGYDLRRLIRGIARSQAYARSSMWDSATRPAPDLFAVAVVRPLSPQAYAASLRLAATNPDSLSKGDDAERARRIQGLVDATRGFAASFELPTDDFQIGSDESLLLSNSEKLAKELLGEGNETLLGKLKTTPDAPTAIDLAIWNIFGRAPEDNERKLLLEYVQQRQDRVVEAYRQMIWAMLTSSECRFAY